MSGVGEYVDKVVAKLKPLSAMQRNESMPTIQRKLQDKNFDAATIQSILNAIKSRLEISDMNIPMEMTVVSEAVSSKAPLGKRPVVVSETEPAKRPKPAKDNFVVPDEDAISRVVADVLPASDTEEDDYEENEEDDEEYEEEEDDDENAIIDLSSDDECTFDSDKFTSKDGSTDWDSMEAAFRRHRDDRRRADMQKPSVLNNIIREMQRGGIPAELTVNQKVSIEDMRAKMAETLLAKKKSEKAELDEAISELQEELSEYETKIAQITAETKDLDKKIATSNDNDKDNLKAIKSKLAAEKRKLGEPKRKLSNSVAILQTRLKNVLLSIDEQEAIVRYAQQPSAATNKMRKHVS